MDKPEDKMRLFEDETILASARPHWNVFLMAAFFGFLGTALLLGAFFQKTLLAWGLCFFAFAVYQIYRAKTTQMLCTNKRILIRSGILLQEVPLKSVETIAVLQNGIGKSLGYGDVRFSCARNRVLIFKKVKNPFWIKNRFKQIILEQQKN